MNTKELISIDDIITSPETIDPVTYQYYKNLKNRAIIINDEIMDSILETAVLPLMEMDNDGTNLPITIILATVGGNVYTGLNLCDVIERLKTPTTIKTMAYAFSMGALILMSGFNNPNVKRVCYPFSCALIHGGSTYLAGSTTQVKDTYKFQEKYEDRIKDYILSHSKITPEEYEKIERYEHYLDSDGMLDAGLVDEIL